ncbi:MAG TPA: S41 family peptidase [Dysgonamonadaceae bacterium]|nr:S41 family peptidase [Dysgonamonadaceae bacterium]
MRKLYSLLSISLIVLFVASSCSDKDLPIVDKPNEESNDNKHVNDWIYENMVTSYYWTNDIPKKPDFSLKPDLFFESLLSNKDRSKDGYRFSWIDEDSDSSESPVSATNSNDIGFEYIRVTHENSNIEYFLVLYPKKGSDAYSKGVNRGRFITAVNGKEITNNNSATILSGTEDKTLTMADFIYDTKTKEYNLTRGEDITIQIEKDFAEKPVYMDSVYTNFGDKKIGYMVYNFFANGETVDSHEYDELLMETLARIKAKGATEMILDLRYNGGGPVSTAIALASALVKDRSTKDVLAKAEYNDLLQREYKENHYFIDKIKFGRKEIPVPALNLPRLYVLVSRYSASASEFIINGLKPYMDVILIGETTYGKNVGSWNISDKDDPKNNWSLQPITVKFYNSEGKSDFSNGFTPDFGVDEFETLRLVEFGNTEDPLLSIAINQITGNALQTRSLGTPKVATQPNMFKVEGSNSIMKDRRRFEMYDDVRNRE